VQRAAYLFAARIADLNCLKLITDPAAVALAYGIYKQDLPAEPDKPRRVLFFDMGHTQTQVCLADFNKAKLVVSTRTRP
jgi:heat shock protein 4